MVLPDTSPSPPTWLAIVRLLRWDKPAGRLILLVPALWAVCTAAQGLPPVGLLWVIVVGTLATSAAGCVINDLWDRNIDPQVARTRDRPLASRTLSLQTGCGVAAIALLAAWGLAAYLNPLSYALCVAAVPVIVLYPLAKRFFPIPQLVLAIAWGFAVLISWSAVVPQLTVATWLLWGATVLWTLGFDTVYAMADREDDRRIGVNSSALFFGDFAPHAVGLCFAGTAGLLAALAIQLAMHWSFWLAWGLAIVGWLWQYLRLLQPTPEIYGQIFRQNVGLGFLLLVGMVAGLIL
ncbi:4-hydroxybenzoate solanesyltransferase [Trichothermofontia sichuanensis B231]|uniref:4-hydroxybenzoate solanesyltransferase n=1 Tax=Trichothermofontia sichuanensis TaxID=3045816 RepID=UPI0022474DF3|nr:4-hydroxybenzoate solanesyltransferase [Trichothermofontia sichuanensis]UZQ54410.1 4-hydroxybenzoate solanesyltransferase [Trichothermofontia sichuanensis B231]